MPTIDDLKSIYGIYKEQIEIVHARLFGTFSVNFEILGSGALEIGVTRGLGRWLGRRQKIDDRSQTLKTDTNHEFASNSE